MNTREIAEEYRLSHWAQIMRERRESGLSIKAFCKNSGYHENVYYYWQRKLREAACEQMTEYQPSPQKTGMTVSGFTEIRMAETLEAPPLSAVGTEGQLHIAVGGMRISADAGYPSEKLAAVLRELTRPC